ncbi:hypothetical protein GCM10010269_39000 [Streptomyces humidus]|uniref:Uncharacterized protein n=1 Tax=Streptomyces humidus TaxID=52259 RepID=A0A918L4Q3_9ACTN|nr:hypothetical protein GCM10010269_39000 [Streptomyces humidus]
MTASDGGDGSGETGAGMAELHVAGGEVNGTVRPSWAGRRTSVAAPERGADGCRASRRAGPPGSCAVPAAGEGAAPAPD